MKWTGIEDGDRVLVSTNLGELWGSVTGVLKSDIAEFPYQVRLDDYPDERRWFGDESIVRLHRGAGPSPVQGDGGRDG